MIRVAEARLKMAHVTPRMSVAVKAGQMPGRVPRGLEYVAPVSSGQ